MRSAAAAHAPRRARGFSAAAEARAPAAPSRRGHPSPRRQPPRHRAGRYTGVAAGDQERVEPGHRAEATSNRPRRQTRLPITHTNHRAIAALVGEEVEPVSGDDLDGFLVDDQEERLQVERHRPKRVRPGSTGHELQVAVDEWMAKREARRSPVGVEDRTRGGIKVIRAPTIAATGGRQWDTTWITRVCADRGHRCFADGFGDDGPARRWAGRRLGRVMARSWHESLAGASLAAQTPSSH